MKGIPAGNALPAKRTRKRQNEPAVHNDSEAVPAFRQSITALNQSPELQLIYDTAPIGLACLSTDCRYLQINRRLTEICGISVAEHIGRSVRETVPQVAEQVEKIVQTVLQTGKPVTDIEVNGQRPDQRNADRFWMTSWHPLKGRDGSIVGVNVVAEEITERKRAEAALVASEMQFRELNRTLEQRVEVQARERDRIWNVSQDLLVVADSGGKYLSVNPAWTTVLGWSESELLGKTGPTTAKELVVRSRTWRPAARRCISEIAYVGREAPTAGFRGLPSLTEEKYTRLPAI
jgi:PAS domain S-box-containing protein